MERKIKNPKALTKVRVKNKQMISHDIFSMEVYTDGLYSKEDLRKIINKIYELSLKSELSKYDIQNLWILTSDKDSHIRFLSYKLLIFHVNQTHTLTLMDRIVTEKNNYARSAIQIALLEIGSKRAIDFLQSQLITEKNPMAKYVLATSMQASGNKFAIKFCHDNNSRLPRWILAKWYSRFLMKKVSLLQFQTFLKSVEQKSEYRRFIESYLRKAGLKLSNQVIS
jgi:hypothetical protein